MKASAFWRVVEIRVLDYDQRWGQAMFNTLYGVIDLSPIHGSLDDPFYRVKTKSSAVQWFNRFIKVDENGNIVGIKVN